MCCGTNLLMCGTPFVVWFFPVMWGFNELFMLNLRLTPGQSESSEESGELMGGL